MEKKSSSSVKLFYPKYDRKTVIEKVKKSIPKLKEIADIKKIILFGSYAKGNFTARSDIDLLIIYKGERNEGLFKEVKKVINLFNLQPHLFTEDEYEKLKHKIDRMIKEGILIYSQ